jgi:pectate lyase
MKSFSRFLLLGSVSFGLVAGATAPRMADRTVPAFPGAEGFGALTTGGRGGEVYRVTNLQDAGPGSFRDAVSQPHRTIVFDVGGVIRLQSNVAVASDVTLAGQSAPGEGIALYGRSVSFSGASNVVVRYLRFREGIGGDRGKCAVNIAGGSQLIFDHCSIQWGRWDCLGVTRGSHDITFQHCLIGEGLDPQRFGALVDSVTNVTFSHNLWINNHSRNPKAKGRIQYLNTVVYNWGVTGLVGGHSAAPHDLDVMGNYFIKGPSSNDRFVGQFAATDHVFQEGNVADLDCDGTLNGRAVVPADFGAGEGRPTFGPRPFMQPPIPVTLQPAAAACSNVLATAGASLRRDAVDRRLIEEVASLGKRGKIIRSEIEVGGIGELVGGTAPLSTAGDGIPDAWKVAHGLDPRAANVANSDCNGDGYPNVEKYLNSLVEQNGSR